MRSRQNFIRNGGCLEWADAEKGGYALKLDFSVGRTIVVRRGNIYVYLCQLGVPIWLRVAAQLI